MTIVAEGVNMWWSVRVPTQSAVLSEELLERAFIALAKDSEKYPSPVIYMDLPMLHWYRCQLTRKNWYAAYREFRMFRTCCERGWLNVRVPAGV